jgi:hypothetical protein
MKYIEDGRYEMLVEGEVVDNYYLGHYFQGDAKIWCVDFIPGDIETRVNHLLAGFRVRDDNSETTPEEFHIKYKDKLDETGKDIIKHYVNHILPKERH